MLPAMTQMRISDAAELLGVSDDTVRRMVDADRLPATRDDAGRLVVEGARQPSGYTEPLLHDLRRRKKDGER